MQTPSLGQSMDGEQTGRNCSFSDEPTLSISVGSYFPSADGSRFLVARVTHHVPGVIDVLANRQSALGE